MSYVTIIQRYVASVWTFPGDDKSSDLLCNILGKSVLPALPNLFWEIIVWASLLFSTLMSFIILYRVIYETCDHMFKSLKIAHISSHILYNLCWISYWFLLLHAGVININKEWNTYLKNSFTNSSRVFGAISNVAIWMIMLFNLHTVSKRTKHHISTQALAVWILLFVLRVIP